MPALRGQRDVVIGAAQRADVVCDPGEERGTARTALAAFVDRLRTGQAAAVFLEALLAKQFGANGRLRVRRWRLEELACVRSKGVQPVDDGGFHPRLCESQQTQGACGKHRCGGDDARGGNTMHAFQR